MKTYQPSTTADHTAGRVDTVDLLSLYFDSGTVHFAIGVKGTFTWDDPDLGEMEIVGTGKLLKLDVPPNALGPQAEAITATLAETYMEEGSDVPVNTFDDGVRETIDDEVWEGRLAILSILHLDAGGAPVEREQVAIREIDQMYVETTSDGYPVRVAVLEEPDITQRDTEGRTSNAEFHATIDPADKSHEHVGVTKDQRIHFGQRPEEPVAASKPGRSK